MTTANIDLARLEISTAYGSLAAAMNGMRDTTAAVKVNAAMDALERAQAALSTTTTETKGTDA